MGQMTMTGPQVEKLLKEGVAAAKATWQDDAFDGEVPASKKELRAHAEDLLRQAIEIDDNNAKAWLWLSTVVTNLDERFICLNNVLAIEPGHPVAEKGLSLLKQKMERSPEPDSSDVRQFPAGYKSVGAPAPDHQDDHPCPFCHQEISYSDTRCPHCETPLVVECPACSTLLDVEWDSCSQCGHLMPGHYLGSVYFTLLATEYKERHRLSKALETLRIAERLNPEQPDLYRQIGEIQAELSEPILAVEALEKAIKKEPEQVGPYLALGKVLQQEGRWEQAEAIYRTAMSVAPKSSETYFAMGDLLLHHNRPKEAKKQLNRAVKIDPQHGLAWARLGQLYETEKRLSAAGRAYRKASKLIPRDTIEGQRVWERLHILDPRLPMNVAMGWSEFLRRMFPPVLICLLAVVVDIGLNDWAIIWADSLALLFGVLGAFLAVSAFSLPRNPIVRLLMGQPQGIEPLKKRGIIGVLGWLLLILALGIVLLPLQ